MDDAVIRRHLSASRVAMLELVRESHCASRDEILSAWSHAFRGISRGADWNTRAVDQLLWQLENLEWIAGRDGGFEVTDAGQRTLEVADRRGVALRR
ncbi:hypothetical protein GCM10009775_33050 [Microbacterium aoyamense]|uniref:ArnR1-like winged helix-turn-helix domain-containing protein n=1 Tax=Microbacterium aoyamense TaxID=344166 RepID=A0ABN2PYW6_9MICO